MIRQFCYACALIFLTFGGYSDGICQEAAPLYEGRTPIEWANYLEQEGPKYDSLVRDAFDTFGSEGYTAIPTLVRLIEISKARRQPRRALLAVECLEQIGSRSRDSASGAIVALHLARLRDVSAGGALGTVGCKSVEFAQLLRDEPSNSLIDEVAAVSGQEVLSAVRDGLESKEPAVQKRSLWAVEGLGPRAGELTLLIASLLENADLQKDALRALSEMGPAAVDSCEKLVTLLKSRPDLSKQILETLAWMGPACSEEIDSLLPITKGPGDAQRSAYHLFNMAAPEKLGEPHPYLSGPLSFHATCRLMGIELRGVADAGQKILSRDVRQQCTWLIAYGCSVRCRDGIITAINGATASNFMRAPDDDAIDVIVRSERLESLSSEFIATDTRLAKLASLNHLNELRFTNDHSLLTVDGARHFAKTSPVSILELGGMGIDDLIIDELCKLRKLEKLILRRTNASPAHVAKLKQQFPKLTIKVN